MDDDEDDELQTWSLRVHGRVQGVGFRDGCARHARLLGVTGWVRNRLDGTVELLAQADSATLVHLREWLRHGVPAARVDDVEVHALPAQPRHANFEQRSTA